MRNRRNRITTLALALLVLTLAGGPSLLAERLVLARGPSLAAANTWSATGSMATTRYGHTATLLPNGKVLVAGGWNGGALTSAEIYDPVSGTWSATGALTTGRAYHTHGDTAA